MIERRSTLQREEAMNGWILKKIQSVAVLAGLGISIAHAAAAPVTLTFEGLQNDEFVSDYYNGGHAGYLDQGSGPGPSDGITFGETAYAVTQSGFGFSNNPSGVTAMSPDLATGGAFLDDTGGFSDGVSFYYSCNAGTSSASIFSGTDGTGQLLATVSLPANSSGYNVFSYVNQSFSGVAESVVFTNGDGRFATLYDDVTVGAAPVPEPATGGIIISGIVALTFIAHRRSRAI
jgi:hypothetical protein